MNYFERRKVFERYDYVSLGFIILAYDKDVREQAFEIAAFPIQVESLYHSSFSASSSEYLNRSGGVPR